MSLAAHNQSQQCQILKVAQNEAWYLSEKAGFDLTQSKDGRSMIRARVAYLMENVVGKWLSEQETTIQIED